MRLRTLLCLLVLTLAPLPATETDAVVRERLRELDPAWYDAEQDGWQQVRPPSSRRTHSDDADGSSGGGTTIDGGGLGGLLTWFIIALVAVLVAAVVAMAVLAWHEDQQPSPTPTSPERQRAGPAPLVVPHFLDLDLDAASRADVLAALDAAMAAGDWRTAVVCCFAAQLVVLAEAGLLHLERGTTNRRFLAQMRTALSDDPPRATALTERFATSIAIFERIYFGHVAAQREQVDTLRVHLDAFRTPGAGAQR